MGACRAGCQWLAATSACDAREPHGRPFRVAPAAPVPSPAAAVPGCSCSHAWVQLPPRLAGPQLCCSSLLIPPTAGLSLLNISLDTLQPERFVAMTRRQGHERVMASIWKAVQLGFDPGQRLSIAEVGQVAWQGLDGMRVTGMARLGVMCERVVVTWKAVQLGCDRGELGCRPWPFWLSIAANQGVRWACCSPWQPWPRAPRSQAALLPPYACLQSRSMWWSCGG